VGWIAGIAVIADIARDREIKDLPRIDADQRGLKGAKSERNDPTKIAI
jgi:hypothetical protein